MTILVSSMANTVIAGYKRAILFVARLTILPEARLWHDIFHMLRLRLCGWDRRTKRAEKKPNTEAVDEGVPENVDEDADEDADDGMDEEMPPTLHPLTTGCADENDLAMRLALAIRNTGQDMKRDPPKRYDFDEWMEYKKLMRFSFDSNKVLEQEQITEGALLAEQKESEWVFNRLTESLVRYLEKQRRLANQELETMGLGGEGCIISLRSAQAKREEGSV